MLAATFTRPLDDPAYGRNALVPGGWPLEVSFSEENPDKLRLDLQPSDVDCSAMARRELALQVVRQHAGPGCRDRAEAWLAHTAPVGFGALLGAAFGSRDLATAGAYTVKAYLELDHAADPGSLPGRMGRAAALVAKCVPGAVPHLVALAVNSDGPAACPQRLYLACRGGLRILSLEALLARFGLRHRLPALAATVAALTGGRLLLPEDSALVAIGERDGSVELKIELLADALAGPQTATLAAIERLLLERPASLAAFRRWRRALAAPPPHAGLSPLGGPSPPAGLSPPGGASQISVVSVRLVGDESPRLNVYQSFAAPAGWRS